MVEAESIELEGQELSGADRITVIRHRVNVVSNASVFPSPLVLSIIVTSSASTQVMWLIGFSQEVQRAPTANGGCSIRHPSR